MQLVSLVLTTLQLLPVSAFRGEGDGNEPILGDAERRAIRQKNGLPSDGFLAANLNRPFKVEPRIFGKREAQTLKNLNQETYILESSALTCRSSRAHTSCQTLQARIINLDMSNFEGSHFLSACLSQLNKTCFF